jgi:hypothetical protein
MEIKVLQHHIDEGTAGQLASCPIALAVKEQIGEVVLVTEESITKRNSGEFLMFSTEHMVAFIRRFDGQVKGVEPFTFDIPEKS